MGDDRSVRIRRAACESEIWTISSFVILFMATFVGVAILFTRMEDYRWTIDGAKMMRDHPGLVTDRTVITAARALKKTEDRPSQ